MLLAGWTGLTSHPPSTLLSPFFIFFILFLFFGLSFFCLLHRLSWIILNKMFHGVLDQCRGSLLVFNKPEVNVSPSWFLTVCYCYLIVSYAEYMQWSNWYTWTSQDSCQFIMCQGSSGPFFLPFLLSWHETTDGQDCLIYDIIQPPFSPPLLHSCQFCTVVILWKCFTVRT